MVVPFPSYYVYFLIVYVSSNKNHKTVVRRGGGILILTVVCFFRRDFYFPLCNFIIFKGFCYDLYVNFYFFLFSTLHP